MEATETTDLTVTVQEAQLIAAALKTHAESRLVMIVDNAENKEYANCLASEARAALELEKEVREQIDD